MRVQSPRPGPQPKRKQKAQTRTPLKRAGLREAAADSPLTGHRNLELAGQEEGAVDGLWAALVVGAIAVEGAVRGDLGVLQRAGVGWDGGGGGGGVRQAERNWCGPA